MPNKTITAIICITAITCVALLKGIDGVLLIASFSAIGALVGIPIGIGISVKRKPKDDLDTS